MKILILDENEVVRRQLFWALRKRYDLAEAVTREEAVPIIDQSAPDVVLMELVQEGDTDESAPVAFLQHLLNRAAPPLILIITRRFSKDVAANLMRLGVLDVLSKPVELEELQALLRRAERLVELRAEPGAGPEAPAPWRPVDARLLGRSQDGETNPLSNIISVDERIKRTLVELRRVAPAPVPVLIAGEPGTGKELFARTLHQLSERRERAFVTLNCAVHSEALLEDQLFGHEKGAFAGAIDFSPGKLSVARGGTLFLDEIGDMDAPVQKKFLDVLIHKRFVRLGDTEPQETDFRLICATHRDLDQHMRRGHFRPDLLEALGAVRLHIPPLRERPHDVKLLARRFLAHFAKEYGRPEKLSFSKEVMRFMLDYPWPVNVRELEYFVERAVALTEGRTIGPEALPDHFKPGHQGPGRVGEGATFDSLVKDYKRKLVMEALQMAGNNKTETAELLGISKSYLFKLIKQMAIPS